MHILQAPLQRAWGAAKGEAKDGSCDGKVDRFGCSRGFGCGGVGDEAEEGKAQWLGLVPCTD
jgi:hypothetical protein